MFTDFINRILGAERRPSVSNRLENAGPSVIVTKDSNRPIPEKYRKDVALLRSKYGDAFKIGLCITLTLQEALSVIPRIGIELMPIEGCNLILKRIGISH